MAFHGTAFDKEFARQALAEKRLTEAQTNELLGGQMGLADQGIERALPVLAHEMGFLPRPLVEQLIRHAVTQRILDRPAAVETLFPESTHDLTG